MLEKIKAVFARVRTWWVAIPDKTLAVRLPLKLTVVVAAGIAVLALALMASRRVEAQFGYEPVTLADFSKLEQKVSACVPAPRATKSKKR